MRIISGKYKGKRLVASQNLPVRPTTDMAKESLFNILNNEFYLEDITALDLFSGTGNISYELASRGAEDITAVDLNAKCYQYIRKMVTELGFDSEIQVIKSDVFKFLSSNKKSYDFIFADPPYDFENDTFMEIPTLVFNRNLLKEEGLLVVEHSAFTDLSSHPNFAEKKRYGSVCFSLFRP